MSAAGVELLAGGPPCQPFSKAGRSKIRHRVRHGLRDPKDERKDLWRSFLEVVRLALPPAVVMENVPDMALDREMFILRTMVHELESLGYAVEERVVDTWRYGVPQFRQRLILVALRDGVAFRWPDETPDKITVWNAIGDLPEVEGGWRPEGGADGWADYDRPVTEFQRRMREGMDGEDAAKVFDHITRPVREDDERAFQLMDATTRYSDLPAEMKRYRDDIFDDKYKRLDEDESVPDHHGAHRQGRLLVHPSAAEPHPDGPRGGAAADLPGPVPVRRPAVGRVPPDRQRRAAAVGEHLGRAVRASLDTPQPGRAVDAGDRRPAGRLVRSAAAAVGAVAARAQPLAGDLGRDPAGSPRLPSRRGRCGRCSPDGKSRPTRWPLRRSSARSAKWLGRGWPGRADP